MSDKITYNCSTCVNQDVECTKEQVRVCLIRSECEFCDNTRYCTPYGKDEGRHCTSCGAEWTVHKSDT